MQVDDAFEERERGEVACSCGCGKQWLVSRGVLRDAGGVTAFVAIPTVHGEHRIAWLALGAGAEPAAWACLRSWVDGSNVAAGVVEPAQTPIRDVLAGNLLPRARVIEDAAGKARVFATHDALLRRHADLQHLFDPERGRDYTFKLPDCVFALPPAQRSPRNNENFAECGDRLFVRALLPIPISDGSELRIGIWTEVAPEAFFGLMKVFWDDEAAYMKLQLRGPVESSLLVAGHDLRGAAVTLAARTPDKCLFVAGSTTPWLAALLRDGISIRDLPQLVREIEQSVKRRAQA